MLTECPFYVGEAWQECGETRSFAVLEVFPVRDRLAVRWTAARHQPRRERRSSRLHLSRGKCQQCCRGARPDGTTGRPLLHHTVTQAVVLQVELQPIVRGTRHGASPCIVAHPRSRVCRGNVPAAVRGRPGSQARFLSLPSPRLRPPPENSAFLFLFP